jgi:hypothetical protein
VKSTFRPLFAPLIVILAGARPALAHIQLDDPPARTTQQKDGPCGAADSPRGETATVFAPGETITVRWRETINHPSHYRIAFDADGDDDFADPADFMDFSGNPTVLLDAIEDRAGGEYSASVTLPDVVCETCTLQLVQVMYDKPPYGDGNDLYYQCADLALRRAEAPGPDASPDGTPEPDAAPEPDAVPRVVPEVPEPAPEDRADAGPATEAPDTADDDGEGCTARPGTPTPAVAGLFAAGLVVAALARRRRR